MSKDTVAIAVKTLEDAGVASRLRSSILELDAILQAWRRRARKRELGHRAIQQLNLDMDLAHLDVLVAIDGPSNEFADSAATETKVATVAERLSIDPSRASRMVSELVSKGYVSRQVSQADSRATVLALTEAGQEIVSTILAHKYLVLAEFLTGWSKEDIDTFLPLLHKFTSWSDQLSTPHDPGIAAEIEGLSKRISKHAVKAAS